MGKQWIENFKKAYKSSALYSIMGKKRNFCIGDIHGHNKALVELLERIKFDYQNDRLISLGDLCDRGPNTWEVIETLMKVKDLICIQGNHDIWLKEYFRDKVLEGHKMEQGFDMTYQSYVDHNFENVDKHIEFLNKQIPYFRLGDTIFTHGGFNRTIPLEQQDVEEFAWDRDLVHQAMSLYKQDKKLDFIDGIETVFIGHTPTFYWNEVILGAGEQPIFTPISAGGVINLDTGCGKGGYLTLYNLDDNTYIQTKDKYFYESDW